MFNKVEMLSTARVLLRWKGDCNTISLGFFTCWKWLAHGFQERLGLCKRVLTKCNAQLQIKSSLLLFFFGLATIYLILLQSSLFSTLKVSQLILLTTWIFNLNFLYCTAVAFPSTHFSGRILHYKLSYSSL